MGRGRRPAALRDQRAELRSLQNVRHQRSQSQHHVGAAGGRRRTELPEHVIARPSDADSVTNKAERSFRDHWDCERWPRQLVPASALPFPWIARFALRASGRHKMIAFTVLKDRGSLVAIGAPAVSAFPGSGWSRAWLDRSAFDGSPRFCLRSGLKNLNGPSGRMQTGRLPAGPKDRLGRAERPGSQQARAATTALRPCGRRAKSSLSPRLPAPDSQFADGDLVTHSLLSWHVAAIGAAVIFGLPPALADQAPTPQELVHSTVSGSYLAARPAGLARDPGTAAAYYLNVLKADPRNADLLGRTFLSVLTDGDIEQAGKLTNRLIQLDLTDRTDRIARLVVGVRALKQKQYAVARQNFSQSVRGPVTDLTAALLSAWTLSGAGDTRGAIDALDRLAGPDWYSIFKDLHGGIILDIANNKKEAGKRYERAYKAAPTALRTVQAYGRFLSRNGSKDDALKIYQDFDKAVPDHPLVAEEMKEISAGEKLPPLAEKTSAGAAEALYGIGASIGRR